MQAGTDEVALVGLRAMLRKRSNVFHKLPNGTWGLREWYPNAKASKGAPDKTVAKENSAPADTAASGKDTGTSDKTEAPAEPVVAETQAA